MRCMRCAQLMHKIEMCNALQLLCLRVGINFAKVSSRSQLKELSALWFVWGGPKTK